MDATTFRILDALSRRLGEPLSINELTRRIKKIYGTAHYVNIYDRLHILERQGIVSLNRLGRSSIVALNFKNYPTVDLLAEMELRRKQEFLRERVDLQMLFMELDTYGRDWYFVKSICSINPERNIRLNRVELLVLLKNSKDGMLTKDEVISIHVALQKLQSTHNLRIDYLTLETQEFIDFLKFGEKNPITEIVSNKIALISPQAFWIEIKEAIDRGFQIKTEETEMKPAMIAQQDLAYNLERFGYKEFGQEIVQGQRVCIEYIVISILMREDARHIQAIPVILAKNRVNYGLLLFLSQKYGLSGGLLGLLKILQKIKPMKEIEETLKIMSVLKIKEIRANEESIMQTMRLYNVV
jgi:hypothetical protein